jgi:hypothetical protein
MRLIALQGRRVTPVVLLLLLSFCCEQVQMKRLARSDKRSISLDVLGDMGATHDFAMKQIPDSDSLMVPIDRLPGQALPKRSVTDEQSYVRTLVERELNKRLASFTSKFQKDTKRPEVTDDSSFAAKFNRKMNRPSRDYDRSDADDEEDDDEDEDGNDDGETQTSNESKDERMLSTMLKYFQNVNLSPDEEKQNRRIRQLIHSVRNLKKRSHLRQSKCRLPF